jgi:hypothetical protein
MKRTDLTAHARARAQQRAISDLKIELLRVFGEDHYQKGGTWVSYIPREKCAQLRRALNKLDAVAMVKDGSDKAITVMHMDKRFNSKGAA